MTRLIGAAVVGVVLAASSAGAQETAPATGFQASDEPIEIVADELEVRQNEGLAVFRGDVDAVQGELRLTADVLNVYYGGDSGAGGGAGLEGGDIERVEAVGNVVVRSATDVATGQEGTYDVAAQRITLTGDVVLTREENVLRGNRLEVDLESGVSTMQAAGESGRVRALFVPQSGEGS